MSKTTWAGIPGFATRVFERLRDRVNDKDGETVAAMIEGILKHDQAPAFPLFLVRIRGSFELLTLKAAGTKHNADPRTKGTCHETEIVGFVLEANLTVRQITPNERNQIEEKSRENNKFVLL